MNLDNLRQEIDGINDDIISTVSKRIGIAKQIADYKKKNKIPIIDKEREDYVISLFEMEFVSRNMKKETGRILARALIDAAIEEERCLIDRQAYAKSTA